MKTTREQQHDTRLRIIASAVDLMTRQGFDATTMKDIARAAGIGDATIYKYFPTKDRIVLGYLDEVAQQALAQTLATPGLAGYGLQEKLQRLTDALLERLLPEREFAAHVCALVRRCPLSMLAEPLTARASLRDAVAGFLQAAEAAGEIEPCGFKSLVGALYCDYLAAVVVYWLADESPEFADSTQLVDLSLALFVQLLRSGLIARALDLAGFVLRSQIARLARCGAGITDMLRGARQALAGLDGAPPRSAPAARAAHQRRAPPGATAGPAPARAARKPAAAQRAAPGAAPRPRANAKPAPARATSNGNARSARRKNPQ